MIIMLTYNLINMMFLFRDLTFLFPLKDCAYVCGGEQGSVA